jgi:hypothetical protein
VNPRSRRLVRDYLTQTSEFDRSISRDKPWPRDRSRQAQSFLDGSGPAAIGAILGSAVPLAAALTQPWQYAVLAGAVALLLGPGPLVRFERLERTSGCFDNMF